MQRKTLIEETRIATVVLHDDLLGNRQCWLFADHNV
jgi:hypothetical protein